MPERFLKPGTLKEERGLANARRQARAAKVADRFGIPAEELRRIALEKARAVGCAIGKGPDAAVSFARTEGRLTQGPVGLYLRALSGRHKTRGRFGSRLSALLGGSITVLLDVPLQVLPSGDVQYIRV